MTRYGFVIDQRRCIGCHACTLACKSENQVPVGVFRTWVKYIEKGEFPNTRRYFTVERCQHCEDAPCVEICPTRSLYKRKDGIVDFDSDRCIGCKSCMQACPYDALYIDPRSHTAAKCHYCAHRTDRGLLPACVVVCPTSAIIAGDLEDQTSQIAQTLGREQVQVRRPDQGTRPQVFYVGADETAITPGLATQPVSYLWSQVGPADTDVEPKGAVLPGPQAPARGQAAGASTTHAVTVYDVAHPKPWGWRVAAYLWTKSVAAGALLVAGPLLALGLVPGPLATVAAILALVFTALTTGLLVWDLKRPERFWRVVLTPNPRSWLVWGAYVLMAFGLLGLLWLVFAAAGGPVPGVLLWPSVVLALATAGYSALLFGQAEGRDFWQSPLLLPQLLGAAVVAGAALLLLVASASAAPGPTLLGALRGTLLAAVLATCAVVLAELYAPHANKDVAAAAGYLTRGPRAGGFWLGYVVLGVLAPVVLLVATAAGAPLPVAALAAIAALVGLWFYEDAWIRAGQSVAMS
jgi:Fe-S-cluster-containing dehydrogenase component/formate-dependent nitrite reductase membrane component NrfD